MNQQCERRINVIQAYFNNDSIFENISSIENLLKEILFLLDPNIKLDPFHFIFHHFSLLLKHFNKFIEQFKQKSYKFTGIEFSFSSSQCLFQLSDYFFTYFEKLIFLLSLN
jgi:hypothetical protein